MGPQKKKHCSTRSVVSEQWDPVLGVWVVDILRMLILPDLRQTPFFFFFKPCGEKKGGFFVFCFFWGRISWRTTAAVLAFSTKDWCLINNVFVLGVGSERRECSRPEVESGISEQLFREWQSQGLVIWTWENSGGAGGEEAAAAAELH